VGSVDVFVSVLMFVCLCLSVYVGAEGPAGYVIEQECPELDTAQQQKTLVGKTVLHAWDNATGMRVFDDWRARARELKGAIARECVR